MRYLVIAAVCVFALATGAPVRAVPLEAYGDLPSLEHVAISPDGSKIAYVGEVQSDRFVIVLRLTGGLVAGLKVGDLKIRSLQWADEGHVIITSSLTAHAEGLIGPRSEYYEATVFDLETKRQENLMAHADENSMNTIFELPERHIVDGKPVVFVESVYYPAEEGVLALYRIDLDDMRTRRVRTGTRNTSDFMVDAAGNPVAQVDYSEGKQHWSLQLHIGDAWKEVYGEDAPIDTPEVEGITADGASILLASRKSGEWKMLAFSLADGSPVVPALSRLAEPVTDPLTDRIIGERMVGHDISYRFFAPADREKWAKVLAHFPAEQVDLESTSDDRSKIIVHVTGRSNGNAYELVDTLNDTVQLIGPVQQAIAVSDIARVTQLVYAASDGRQLDAYLTLPSGRPAEKLALIVMPHGGPAARDEPGFDWWAQALAAQGYAVLQPQFRGSDGFGWELLAAGFGEWGRRMQTDLSDGVRALVRAGIADPKRVCIVGASYGGYAALAGATLDPGVYRCAVSVSGVSDPSSFIEWSNSRERRSDSQTERYWTRFMGASSPDDPVLTTISPMKQVARSTIPILLVHGKDDTVVPLSQSEDMASALKRAGKSYNMVVLDGEDHWLSRAKTRQQMLKTSVDFLMAQNPP